MKIKSVHIQNFRALKDVEVEFDSITTFIGPNGTGKSTVLHALDWFFNAKTAMLSDTDCSSGATAEDIEVSVTFSDLTDRDREQLTKYAPPEATTFTAWKIRNPNGSEFMSANAKGFVDFNAIKLAATATQKKELYKELRASQAELRLPAASTGPAVDQAITTWESEHRDRLVDVPETLQTNFFGFNSGGKMSGLFDFVFVTADLRATEESLDARASVIGRILERSVDRTAADEAISVIVEDSRKKQQDVYNTTFQAQLDTITTQLNEVVESYSPGRFVSVTPADVELKAPRTTFDVSIIDGPTETSVGRQGHGFQRTLLISALQVLAKSGPASTEGTICLAIEEPELFQHPIQAQAFAKVLRSLAEDEGKRVQVAYATHSPYFVEARHFDQIRRLTRSTSTPPKVTVHSATASSVKKLLDGVVEGTKVDRQLDEAPSGQLSVALFANRAFVVEGTTESAIFYGLGDRESNGALEAAGLAIVPAGGKSRIPLSHAILSSLGIPTYALFDGDGGFRDRALQNGKLPDKIESEMASHVAANRTVLKYFGLPEVDFPTAAITANVAVFDDQLEAYLSANWPAWMTSCEEVSAASAISFSKNQYAYRSATLRADEPVPEMLIQILAMAKGA